jgi:hypothetical protein
MGHIILNIIHIVHLLKFGNAVKLQKLICIIAMVQAFFHRLPLLAKSVSYNKNNT